MVLAGLLTITLLVWRPVQRGLAARHSDDRGRQGELVVLAEGLDEAFEPTPSRLVIGAATGAIRVEPDHMTAAQVGTYTVHFTVGAGGIATAGGLLFDLPKAWFAELYPWPKPFQQVQPGAAHFVSAAASRADVELDVKLQQRNFDGKTTRYPHIAAVTVEGGHLRAGDEVRLTLHNTTAPYLAGEDSIRAAVDRSGEGAYRLLPRPARYRVDAAAATDFALFGPSQVVVGEAVELQLTVFDRFANLARARGKVVAAGLAASALPPSAGALERGAVRFRWVPRRTGFHWPVAVLRLAAEGGEAERRIAGDPIRVYAKPPAERIFWGDLHSHSAISKDAVGHDDFRYARDITRLDFLAPTEHSEDDVNWRREKDGITPQEWQTIRRRVRRFYDPGRFVTLLGYECTFHDGHHCVYFRSEEGVPWNPRRLGSVANLWKRLEPGTAFTIPHHLGRTTAASWPRIVRHAGLGPPPPYERRRHGPWVDWRPPGPTAIELRPNLEIYSLHGSSEYDDPQDALAYNKVGYLPSHPQPGPHYARDAWALGHRVGTVAGSDNHTAQPGQPHAGLTAVLAPRLEREAIFDAIVARRTYATTGRRIYLEFEVSGTPMGGTGRCGSDPDGRVLLAAAGQIELAQLMRFSDPEAGWQVAKEWREIDRLLDDRFVDRLDSSSGEVIYYLRAQLSEPTRGRTVRAWTSPVWLEIQP